MLERCRWRAHPAASTLVDMLEHVKVTGPMAGVVENVAGFTFGDSSEGDKSPLTFTIESLHSMGYAAASVMMCLSSYHCAVRTRLAPRNCQP